MSSSGFSKILSNEVRMEQDDAQDEEDSEDARQDPSWTRDAVEHSVVETDFIEQTTKERTSRKSGCLPNDKPACESGTPADADNSVVGTISLRVHPEREAKARDYPPDEDQVEEISLVREGVEDLS